MALWVLLIWLVVGVITGFVTRKISKRVSAFGMIGDGILGGAGGVIGGYLVALTVRGNGTLGELILTIATAISCAVLAVWITKFITRP